MVHILSKDETAFSGLTPDRKLFVTQFYGTGEYLLMGKIPPNPHLAYCIRRKN